MAVNHHLHTDPDCSEAATLLKDRTSESAHSSTTLALKLVSSIADGVINVPVLKPVAEVALQIVGVIKQVKSNRKDCDIVASRTIDLIHAMANVLVGWQDEDIDQHLKDDISQFEDNLTKVLMIVLEQAERRSFARILNYVGDSEDIRQCKEIIEHSYKLFQVRSAITVRLRMQKVESYANNFHSRSSAKSKRPSTKQLAIRNTSCIHHYDPILVYGDNLQYSQFSARSRHSVLYRGKMYPSADHLYHAFKFEPNTKLVEWMRTISSNPSVVHEEAFRHMVNERSDWKEVRNHKLEEAFWYKFTQHADIQHDLLATGECPIIYNTDHSVWGIDRDGSGENQAGKALERVRYNIRNGIPPGYFGQGTSQ